MSTLCLVTDRRRLGAATGAPPSAYIDMLTRQILAAGASGIDLVQIREADLDARSLAGLVRTVVGQLRGTATKVLVNDRLDVALAAGADGVHLKENSLPLELVRSRGPMPFIVSCAVHTPLTAAARRSADFLVAGTVLPTVSKSRADYLEWKGLGKVIAAAGKTPVLAIGGLGLESIPSLVASGAAGLAAIGAFIPAPGDLRLEEFVRNRIKDMRFAFDSAQSDP
jgi:thiamine-phosphate pyrophosphorylase